ncbi:MAG: EamA family transporter [Gammaproteobacteria bacterium]|jgi:O-acetylserine/cysteine efflux transporter
MSLQHFAIIVLLTAIWGFNFVAIKFGLNFIPPIEFCCIRFFLVSMPAIFFIKPPSTSFKLIATYGLIMFALQFSLLFIGIYMGITAGLASLLFQTQVFFSILLAVIFLNEKITIWQIIGALIAFFGIVIIGINLKNDTSLIGFALVLAAAIAWGLGNLISKKIKTTNILSLVVWGGFFSWPLLLLMSIFFEGTDKIIDSFYHYTWGSIFAVIYIVYISTLLGFYIWNWLLNKYPISIVAPFCLLVPIFGMLSSMLLLEEPLEWWKFVAILLVLLGLYINSYFAKQRN